MYNPPKFRPHELAEIYPAARGTIRRLLKEARDDLRREAEARQKIKEFCFQYVKRHQNLWFWEEAIEAITMPRSDAQERVDRYTYLLRCFEDERERKDAYSLDRAKSFPIVQLLEFNHQGFARCIWHDEKTPSMKYYPAQNRVYCFSCNAHGDAVDVYMKMRGYSFKEAVKALT